jgi:hypothetical protein
MKIAYECVRYAFGELDKRVDYLQVIYEFALHICKLGSLGLRVRHLNWDIYLELHF